MPREPEMKKSKITTAGKKVGGSGGRDGDYEPVASKVYIGGKLQNASDKRPKARPMTVETNVGAKSADVATSKKPRARPKPPVKAKTGDDYADGPPRRGGKRRMEDMSTGPRKRLGKRRGKTSADKARARTGAGKTRGSIRW